MIPNLIFALQCFMVVTLIQCEEECLPQHPGFYWRLCKDQAFTNLVVPTNVVATQNGKTLSTQGIDATVDLVIVTDITNNFGKIDGDPLVDLTLRKFTKLGDKCVWEDLPTISAMIDVNACDFIDKNVCHLDDKPNPPQLSATLNIGKLAGDFKDMLEKDTYYGVQAILKAKLDTPIMCIYFHDKLINI